MNVRQLIRQLKKMPQNLEVEVAMHDNAEYESAGVVTDVMHFIKAEFCDQWMDDEALRVFADMRDECVIIQC